MAGLGICIYLGMAISSNTKSIYYKWQQLINWLQISHRIKYVCKELDRNFRESTQQKPGAPFTNMYKL